MSVEGDERRAGLSHPTHHYTDYGVWQSQWLRGAEASSRREYWQRSLSDLSEVLRLSPDKPVTEQVPGRLGRSEIRLPSGLRDRVMSYGRREGLTPFTLLLGLWQVLLYRLTGNADILIGTPVSERRAACWQGVMGLFLNMVPVRMHVDGGSTFSGHLQRLRRLVEEIMEQGDLPYSEIASLAKGLEVGPFHSILQLGFIITERNDTGLQDGILYSEDKPHASFAADDMVFLADVSGDDWRIGIKFDLDRYSEDRVMVYLRSYQWLMTQVFDDEDRSLDELLLVKPSERIQLIRLGLGDRSPLPADPLIHRLFERQVEIQPNAVAIDHAGRQISYAALDAEAGRWAAFLLRDACLRQGEVVALILPQGILHVTFVLAVMKAGAAVVPIDTALPDVRISYMLTDCGARIVVAGAGGLRHLLSRHHRVDPDSGYGDISGVTETIQCAPSDPAYGMYTSGSTGMPKGIFNTHVGFSNMIASNGRAMGIRPGDRIAQLSTPSFDVSLFEIFLALHNGATLVVPGKLELSVLPSFIVEKRVSVAMLTPMVVSTLDTGTLSHLRILMTGGEEARPADVIRLYEKLTYFNIYGPTEVAVWSTLHKVTHQSDDGMKVPIGRPMDNYFVCVLDSAMRMLPMGIPGELYIGGIGLGLGYHGKPDLTSAHFVESPFRKGDLLYRTGDIAWWNPQGELVYAGRKDGQVKVMGFRVELQEVERSLEGLRGIRQAVVIPVRRLTGEHLLAAFIVSGPELQDDDTIIREALADRLPRYMLPDRIHRIHAVPLNHNGKVDRRQLEQLDELCVNAMKEASETDERPLLTDTEKTLGAIWSELLGISVIGPDAGFFTLGGNSLQLIRLMVMIRSRWGIQPDVTKIYTHITLRSMAGLIDRWTLDRPIYFSRDIHPVDVWGKGDGYPIYAMVGGAGSLEEYTKYHRIGEQLGDAFRMVILPDPDAAAGRFPRLSLNVLADQYARFIASSMKKGPFVLLGDCIGGIDAFATACALQDMGISDVAVVMLDTSAPGFFPSSKTTVIARDTYLRLPEQSGPLSEWCCGRFLALHRKTGIGRWIYRAPQSRRQLRSMAFALGLFSMGEQKGQFVGEPTDDGHRSLEIYLESGWKNLQPPSAGFNAARYRKQVPSFDPNLDDPVSHALLIGMRGGYVRRRLFLKMKEPLGRSDIMAARTWLRRESFKPGRFNGRIMLILSEKIYARGGMRGWDRYVDGIIEVRPGKGDHRSYLREHIEETAMVVSRAIGKLIQSFRAPGES
jgi:amino acid adenylation domain-containing protein